MKISQREREVLGIMYTADQALTSSQIVNLGNGMTQSTVQAVLRRLMAADLIEVQGITYSGKVLSRTFGVTEKAKELLIQHFLEFLRTYKSIIGLRVVIRGMFEMEEDEMGKKELVNALEEQLIKMKGQIKK